MSSDGHAIFVDNVLHFVSTADSREEAYEEYAERVGFDPSEAPMTRERIGFHDISPENMEDWENATAHNYPTVDHPL